MTRIEFFVNLDNKFEKLVELVALAQQKGRRVLVLTETPSSSQQVSQALWSLQPQSFIPHVVFPTPLTDDTPTWVTHEDDGLRIHDVLVNLCPATPPFFSRYTRLIELVANDEADKVPARQRFKFYKDRGYEIKYHDLKQ